MLFYQTPEDIAIVAWYDSQTEDTLAALPPSSHNHRIYAASRWSQELCGFMPTHPARQRLLCGSCSSAHDLRSTLPSHTRSPSCSCVSLCSL